MNIASHLENKTIKELYSLARRANITGWHEMRKGEIIASLRKKLPRLHEITRELVMEIEQLEQQNTRRKKAVSTKELKVKKSESESNRSKVEKRNEETASPARKKAVGKVQPASSRSAPASKSTERTLSPRQEKESSDTQKKTTSSGKKSMAESRRKKTAESPVSGKTTKSISNKTVPPTETDESVSAGPIRKKAAAGISVRPNKNASATSTESSRKSTSSKETQENIPASGDKTVDKSSDKTTREKMADVSEKKAIDKKTIELPVNEEKTTDSSKMKPVVVTDSTSAATEKPAPNTLPASGVTEPSGSSGSTDESNGVQSEAQRRITSLKEKLLQQKSLGSTSPDRREAKDQLLLMVRDPFWLHAYWEIGQPLVERIRAAMGHLWYTADPVLRLYRIHSDNVGALRQEYLSDIHIHGGINNWYIDVDDPPSKFLVDIGYLARDGQFFILLSSNLVETPQRYVHDSFGHPDVSWMGVPTDFCSGSLLQDTSTLQQLPGTEPTSYSFSTGFSSGGNHENEIPAIFDDPNRSFPFVVDAELVIKGRTGQNVQLKIKDESIRLKEDGTFSIRYHLPERRHVFPVVAMSADGIETQTVILAIERNTKVMETVIKDGDEE